MDLEKIIPVLPSLNFDSTAQFYQSLLGDAEIFRTPEYLILSFKDMAREIHFYNSTNPKDGECAGLFLRVKNIGRYHERAKISQSRILKSLRDEPWGQREFCVLDPTGCLLRFGEPVLKKEKTPQTFQ